ncbi:MAG: ATP-binding cassette domain-containing protein, partial [Kiritimatiellia bacterium]
MNAIVAENLVYRYPFCDTPSLDGVSFTLAKGEALLVTGASGCGKSTLLRILNGLVPNHFKGRIEGRLDLLGLALPAPLEQISRRVGTVLQNPEEQIMATTVQEEVALALEWQSVPPDEIRRRVAAALAAFGLAPLAARSVFGLSSGERQKCVLAAVMAAGADVVVMDEPTANLSPAATEELAGICLALKRRGVTLVIADHRLYWLRGVLDRVLVLKDGKTAFAAQRGGTDPLDALAVRPEFASWGLRGVDVRRTALRAPAPCGGAETPAVAIRNLAFRYSRTAEWICRDFSADIPRGKVVAVVGANGAGKTTLARLLCGLLKPAAGAIAFPAGGTSAAAVTPRQRRARTAFVMQQMDIQLYMRTVEVELLFSAPRAVGKAERRADAAHWLEVFGLAPLKDR